MIRKINEIIINDRGVNCVTQLFRRRRKNYNKVSRTSIQKHTRLYFCTPRFLEECKSCEVY